MSSNILIPNCGLPLAIPPHLLEEMCQSLEPIPEYKALLEVIGRVEVVVERSLSPGAACFEDSRIILEPSLFKKKIGGLYPHAVGWLLFEMYNLAQKTEFYAIRNSAAELSPDVFVEQLERLEHRSALKTKAIVRKIFAREEWDNVPLTRAYDSFALHYLLQQIKGHSEAIWGRYSHLFPAGAAYSGRCEGAITAEEKRYILSFITFLADAADPEPFIAGPAVEGLALLKQYITSRKGIGEEGELLTRLSLHISEIEALVQEEAVSAIPYFADTF